MTEPERDERVTQAYRAIGSEEPPAVLDAAILAAARRRGKRWQAPLAVAAALALAVGVALVVEREERAKTEDVALAPQVMESPAPAAGARVESRPAAAPAAPAAGKRERSDEAEQRKAQASAPAADQAAPAAGVAGALRAAKPPEQAETPELWLERIAALREQGRDREAGESLAEFRRRHPDYRIPEPMLRRVAPR